MTDRTNYIDRQTAYEVLTAYYHHSTETQHNALREALNKVPSADVQPVRHGKWLDGYGFAGNYFDCFVCNQCKNENMAKTNYCPHCGARMDGEQDG